MNDLTEGLMVLLSWKILATAIAVYAIIALMKKVITINEISKRGVYIVSMKTKTEKGIKDE